MMFPSVGPQERKTRARARASHGNAAKTNYHQTEDGKLCVPVRGDEEDKDEEEDQDEADWREEGPDARVPNPWPSR